METNLHLNKAGSGTKKIDQGPHFSHHLNQSFDMMTPLVKCCLATLSGDGRGNTLLMCCPHRN